MVNEENLARWKWHQENIATVSARDVSSEKLKEIEENKNATIAMAGALIRDPIKIIEGVYKGLEKAAQDGDHEGVSFGTVGLSNVLNLAEYFGVLPQGVRDDYNKKVDELSNTLSAGANQR